VRDISNWFEARSTDQDSAGIRRYFDNLVRRLTGAQSESHEDARVAPAVGPVPDPAHPDESDDSL
jgi:hypothetical protein